MRRKNINNYMHRANNKINTIFIHNTEENNAIVIDIHNTNKNKNIQLETNSK